EINENLKSLREEKTETTEKAEQVAEPTVLPKENEQSATEPVVEKSTELSEIENTAKALEGIKFNAEFNLPLEESRTPQQVAEAYHKAKADGSNPELVKAVEEVLPIEKTTPIEDEVSPTVELSTENTNVIDETKQEKSNI